ncbi:hypothetical protein G5I_09559 [Acromyrmex echinatior]|uniref:Uncharacterized protein n=1 Tax=Acromyrmex echinatior TaxID=103372 RepID=F4WUI8_ACREC|nr:hypothetical protein G5I_09559 [Acromyrmex echinatior]
MHGDVKFALVLWKRGTSACYSKLSNQRHDEESLRSSIRVLNMRPHHRVREAVTKITRGTEVLLFVFRTDAARTRPAGAVSQFSARLAPPSCKESPPARLDFLDFIDCEKYI